ncbi:MAG TPA: type II pantothenate kinase [Bacillales bacterium]|nr:type II pantothenate kinase [Bacillales bacterium]
MRIGVDAGGTLIKAAYMNESEMKYRTFATKHMDDAVAWLHREFSGAKMCITGGKAAELASRLSFHLERQDEFQATCLGAIYLMKEQNTNASDRFVLANVGTGTSIHVVNGEKFWRASGTGVGGGTFVGLSALLTGEDDFEKLVELAEKGDRSKLDLLVKDIYTMTDSQISGNLTASNFGKADSSVESGAADRVAAVLKMVAETVILLSTQACDRYETDTVVFIGSTFHNHPLMRETVKSYEKMAGKKVVFLQNGHMSGAVGAWLSLAER